MNKTNNELNIIQRDILNISKWMLFNIFLNIKLLVLLSLWVGGGILIGYYTGDIKIIEVNWLAGIGVFLMLIPPSLYIVIKDMEIKNDIQR